MVAKPPGIAAAFLAENASPAKYISFCQKSKGFPRNSPADFYLGPLLRTKSYIYRPLGGYFGKIYQKTKDFAFLASLLVESKRKWKNEAGE